MRKGPEQCSKASKRIPVNIQYFCFTANHSAYQKTIPLQQAPPADPLPPSGDDPDIISRSKAIYPSKMDFSRLGACLAPLLLLSQLSASCASVRHGIIAAATRPAITSLAP